MSDSEGAAAARAAEQARLRKERREAKIRAGGASRLDRISGLGGGVKKDPVSTPPATQAQEPIASAATTAASTPGSQQEQQPMMPSAPPQQQQQQHGDPDEIDISQHFYQPQPPTRFPTAAKNQQPPPSMDEQAQLRQMMLMGLNGPMGDPTADGLGNMGTVPPGMGGEPGQDPMMNLMMQFLGGGGGAGAGGMPPFSAMGGQAQAQGGQQQQAMLPDRYDSLWRLLHTAVAFGLGLYIALWTRFSGSKLEREGAAAGAGAGRGSISGQANTDLPGFQQFGGQQQQQQQQQQATMMLDGDMASVRERFVWAFATAEAVLLTTRFFLDLSRPQQGQGGILSTLAGFLPQPAKGRVQAVLRYKDVFTTVRRDVLVCVFVLGACSWLRA